MTPSDILFALLSNILIPAAAVVISLVAIRIARRSGRNATRLSRYTYLANQWYEIRKIEMNYPNFVDEKMTKDYKSSFTKDDLPRYGIFAHTCWGHAEDIFRNYHSDDPGFLPTVKRYKDVHHQWLQNNSRLFDPKFIAFIDEL